MENVRTRLQNNDPSLTCLSLDEIDEELEAAISGNTFLQELTIRNTPTISTTLFASVSDNLKILRLDNVGMTVQSLKNNNKNMKQQRTNHQMQELSLANNPKLGPRGCQQLRKELLHFPNLIVLNLENIGMGHYGAQGLEFPRNLQSLNLSRNKLGIDGIWKLSLPLNSLVELNVSQNAISDDGCMELTKILPINLRSLTLSSNGIGTPGMEALAKALQSHSSLQELYISDNCIRQVGALAELLAQPATTETDPDESWDPLSQSSLRVLDISHNQLESRACLKLAEALRTNTTLQRLDLSFNQIDDEGAGGFVEILDENTGLQELLLAGNESISDARQRILDMLLKHRTQRVYMPVDENVISRHFVAQGASPDESAGLMAEYDQEQVRNGYGLLEGVLRSTEPPCLDGGEDLLGFVAHATRQYDLRYVVSYGAFGVLYRLDEQKKGLLVRCLRLRDPTNRSDAMVQEVKTLHQKHSIQRTIAPIVAFACSDITFTFVYHVHGSNSLAEELRGNGDSLSWHRRIQILQSVTDALNCLHSTVNGCPSSFHGDLNSKTIYVSKTNDSGLTVQLLDCSLNRLPTVDAARWLAGDVVYGSRGYRCPRYERGSCRYDSFSDMFSLGIVGAELLTGRLQASKHEGGAAWDVYYDSVLRKQPLVPDPAIGPPPGKHVVTVLGRIIGLCLNPNVQQRPSAAFVLQLLAQLMRDIQQGGSTTIASSFD